MQEALTPYGFSTEEIQLLRETQKFFLIFDAYDEMNIFENIYVSNAMEAWNAKIMVSCRPSYLSQDTGYRRFFKPSRHQKLIDAEFQEYYVSPFVPGQIDQYITQYLKVKGDELLKQTMRRQDFGKEWLLAETYKHWIERIPGLNELTDQPFLLRITMEVLPQVVIEFQSYQQTQETYLATRARLYDKFVDRWFAQQVNKLVGAGHNLPRSFEKDCIAFSKALAKLMYKNKVQVVQYEDTSSVDSFTEPEEQAPAIDLSQWAVFFSDELVKQDKGKEESRINRIRIRKACMLRKAGDNQWAFLHSSLLDYFWSLNNFQPVARPSVVPVPAAVPAVEPVSAPPLMRHRSVGTFFLMNRLDRAEADDLWRQEGVRVVFNAGEDRQKVVIGQGNFGKFRIARHAVNHRFAGVKKIRGEAFIKSSRDEGMIQSELNDLPHIMPLWDSRMIKSKKTGEDVLLQFMPLVGFGNGEQLLKLLRHIEDNVLKEKLLLHILKSLLIGLKGMHSHRVSHLDIKPANFMIDCRGMVYIIDFGCAHREFSDKRDAFWDGGVGDSNYFSPERLAFKRKCCLKKLQPSDQYELADRFDCEKADVWAVGISMLQLFLENLRFLPESNISAKLILEKWSSPFFTAVFEGIIGWNTAPDNSLLGLVKKLLHLDQNQRLSAAEALKCPVFLDPAKQLSPQELGTLMQRLIEFKDNPPVKPNNNNCPGVAVGIYTDALIQPNLTYTVLSSAMEDEPSQGPSPK